MKLRILLCGVLVVACSPHADAIDWLHAPAKYTHDPQTGRRVAQFTPVDPVYVQVRPDYLKSGFRFNRSTLRGASGSAEYVHTVEQWGRPVRPYGEWKFPYRPYSVPYSAWGPPYGGLGGSNVYGGVTPYGRGVTPYGRGGYGPQPGVGFGNGFRGGGPVPGNIGRGNIGGGNIRNGADHFGAADRRRDARDDFRIRNPRTDGNLNPRQLPHRHHPHAAAPRIDAGAAVGGT